MYQWPLPLFLCAVSPLSDWVKGCPGKVIPPHRGHGPLLTQVTRVNSSASLARSTVLCVVNQPYIITLVYLSQVYCMQPCIMSYICVFMPKMCVLVFFFLYWFGSLFLWAASYCHPLFCSWAHNLLQWPDLCRSVLLSLQYYFSYHHTLLSYR